MTEGTIMFSHTIEIRQVFQCIQVRGAHMANAFKLAWSNSPPIFTRCHEPQQLGVVAVIVEDEKWDREGRSNAVELDEGDNLKHLIQGSKSPWQANK